MKNFIQVTSDNESRLINIAHIIRVQASGSGKSIIFHAQSGNVNQVVVDQSYSEIIQLLENQE